MKHLSLPCADLDDDRVITTLCKRPQYLPHKAKWLAAYEAYRKEGSNPWTVVPSTFVPDISAAQQELYEGRKSNGPIRRIRRTRGLLCCPLCGSPTTGSVDHLLPKAVYPELSIMRANLVPACVHCNSASKGNKHRGAAAPERFIHPYFDKFADQALWMVSINPPFPAATFDPTPLATLQEPVLSIVRYHLAHVLGDEFRRRMETLWSTYPGEVKIAAQGAAITTASTENQLTIDLQRRAMSFGTNGWETALLRGIASDPNAIAHVAQSAIAYPI